MEKITSRRNPLCVHMKNLGASRSYREEHREFLCDGIKLLEEAVKAGAEVTNVIASSHLPFPLPVDARVCFTDRSIIDSISPLKNAQNTLFTTKMLPQGGFERGNGPYFLLDGVQDPGNAGTIIRTASAFGVEGVMMTGNCADRYNPKTVRATMGAVFRQKTYSMTIDELTSLQLDGVIFIGAAAWGADDETYQPVVPGSLKNFRSGRDENPLKNTVFAIGSEGRGLSDEVLELCAGKISIPISPECESLNAAVAAAIIMWETSGL